MTAHPNIHSSSYRAFVLRVWHEGESGPWRASLQSVTTGERISFNTLERLCVYLLTLDDLAVSIITTDLTTVNNQEPYKHGEGKGEHPPSG